jgi:predicted oxidoreductase
LIGPSDSGECDVLVIGSGSAGLAAALRSAVAGLRVVILEKSGYLGGTSAMSGAGTWVPANHCAAEAGLADSPAEALQYLRAASPAGWEAHEDARWAAFAANAPRMLAFLEKVTPLRFALTQEPDVMPERAGGKLRGRMVSPLPLNRSILGTKGGARTNAKGQVLRADGTVIAGLYAAGLAMANPIGTRAVGPGRRSVPISPGASSAAAR